MGENELHFQKGLSKLSLEPLSDADFEPKKKKTTRISSTCWTTTSSHDEPKLNFGYER